MRPLTAFRGLAYLGLTLVAAILLQPFVAAQAPAQPIVQVNIDASPTDFTIRQSQGSTSFNFTITFTCQSAGTSGTGTCTGQAGETNVELTYNETRAPYPEGWEVEWSAFPREAQAKDRLSVRADVRLLDDEPARDFFDIGLSVRAQPVTNSALDPLLGGQLGQASSAADTVGVTKVLNVGEQLTSWARAYMWPLLGAAVILLVAGVVLVERKRGALNVSSDAASQPIQPGRGTSFPIRIANDTKGDDRVALSVVNLPPDWTAIVPLSELELRPGERTQMWITLRAPPEAIPGQTLNFALRARSARGSRAADVGLQVTVVAGPSQGPVDVPAPPPAPPIDFSEETVEAAPSRRRR